MDKSAITKTLTQYMAAWNEPDDTARRALLEQCWSNSGVYLDPNVSLPGRDALATKIGEVLASAVSLLNPSVIVISGSLAEAGDPLLAGVREVVYRRSLPLATANLRIVQASAGDLAGVLGASVMVIDHVLSPDAVDRYVG